VEDPVCDTDSQLSCPVKLPDGQCIGGTSSGFAPDRIRVMLDDDPEQFSWVDRAGLLYYLSTRPS
jgi:hypothetical protein